MLTLRYPLFRFRVWHDRCAPKLDHDLVLQTGIPEVAMTAPTPDPWPAPDPTPYPSRTDPAPNPDEAPVHIINLPPDTIPPGVPIDNPERGD
jgi:hypothetical protein